MRVIDYVDLIILVHKCGPELISRSCKALSAAMGVHWHGSLILVENAAAPRTSEAARKFLLEHFGGAKRIVIRSARNLGFGSAINVGMDLADNRYVGVFNPDGAVAPGTVSELATALQDEPAALMAGPIVVPFSSDPQETGPERVHEVEWLPGVAAVYRREAFLEIGGFDPLYFMYSEDVEMSARARRAGWRLLRVPSAVFRHEHDWTAWDRFARLRLWTISATTLSYQSAPSRCLTMGRLAVKRARWFADLARQGRMAQLAGAVLGTLWWPTKILGIEVRRRNPWNGRALRLWLRRTAPRLERVVVR